MRLQSCRLLIFLTILCCYIQPAFSHWHNFDCTGDAPCFQQSTESATTSQEVLIEHTDEEFSAQETWWISVFWEDNLLPALMMMAEQLSAVAVKQTEAVGGFIDAKHQMETQQVLQKISARAHKDYVPSTGMCEFGSTVKSLAASERQGEANAVILAQRSQDRGLGNANTAAANINSDVYSRLKQFREVYCNPADNNGGLDYMCEHDQNGSISSGEDIGGEDSYRFNKDIDYYRTLVQPWTLNVNFTDGETTPSADEEDVLAMAANLYSREVFKRPQSVDLMPDPDEAGSLTTMQEAYMDARAVLAKRSVAENSYNALVGMKSAGTAGSRDFLESILAELGINDSTEDVQRAESDSPSEVSRLDALLGDDPSYYAQMEVLTKKIYQNPDFYTNLYDTPANVSRKGVAIQAIGLMQKFDLLKSFLRNEANQSVLLELAIIDLQKEIENNLEEQNLGGN